MVVWLQTTAAILESCTKLWTLVMKLDILFLPKELGQFQFIYTFLILVARWD